MLQNIVNKIVAAIYGLPSFIREDQVIGVRRGYYTNSALDMAQYEETRGACAVVFMDNNLVKGYGEWYVDAAMKERSKRDKETLVFGDIGTTRVDKIEKWAEDVLKRVNVLEDAKRGWTSIKSNRRSNLSHLLEMALNEYNLNNPVNPVVTIPQSDKVELEALKNHLAIVEKHGLMSKSEIDALKKKIEELTKS